jgi:hypothetical protein
VQRPVKANAAIRDRWRQLFERREDRAVAAAPVALLQLSTLSDQCLARRFAPLVNFLPTFHRPVPVSNTRTLRAEPSPVQTKEPPQGNPQYRSVRALAEASSDRRRGSALVTDRVSNDFRELRSAPAA